MTKPKTIAIIGARGGSKGLPRKNLLPLAGKPLLAHTLEHAKASGVCDIVLLTTDDEQMAAVGRQVGAEVLMRPPELGADMVPAEPVIQHALTTYEAKTGTTFDIVVYLQTTDVLRSPDMIRQCVERLWAQPDIESVFSAYATHKNYWRKRKDGQGYERLAPDLQYAARQVREHIFREDTGIACATRAHIVRAGKRIGTKVDILPTEDFRTSIDIHTSMDFWLAEKLMTEWPLRAAAGPSDPGAWLGTDVKSWSQSIRNGYTRAFLLFALHETGVLDALRRGGPKTSADLAAECKIDGHLLDGVLNFWAHSDRVIVKQGERFALVEPYVEWLFADMTQTMAYGAIGAYACLLYELVPCLRGERHYGKDFERRGDLIAKASFLTGKGNYPWVVEELRRLGCRTVADLGCGSANVLIGFCQMDPDLRGVGVDISAAALDEARRRVKAAGLHGRIRLIEGDLTRPETFEKQVGDVQAFNGIMVFHEFLRDGEGAVVAMLQRMKKSFPGRYLLLGEFDRVSDAGYQAMSYADRIHPLFYQYIIHPLTWQGLPMEKDRWTRLFERAGLEIVKVKDDFPFRLVEYVLRF